MLVEVQRKEKSDSWLAVHPPHPDILSVKSGPWHLGSSVCSLPHGSPNIPKGLVQIILNLPSPQRRPAKQHISESEINHTLGIRKI